MVDPVPLRDFDLLRPIGEGATGRVWYGVHRTTGTPVAVKTLHHFLHDPDIVALFEREARAIASLDHPHVVALLDFGTVDQQAASWGGGRLVEGAPFLVMEHISGGTLASPPISDAVGLREVLTALLSALSHAHSRGVLHRDLKLTNVLRGGNGDLRPGFRLVDFGIAWFGRSEGDDLLSVGTPAYMAPEQLTGESGALGPWTDLYALASLTWRLVTGLPPAHAENRLSLLHQKAQQTFRPFVPRFCVPDGLEAVLRATLVPQPDERPKSAAALTRLLDALPWGFQLEPENERRPPQLLGAGLPLLALRPDEPVGRERALAKLHGALRRVREHGNLEVAVIRAEAGLDGDALVRHFCDISEEEGPAVSVRLDGRDPDVPSRVLRRLTGSAELQGEALTQRLRRYLVSRGELSEMALAVLSDMLRSESSDELERQQERERRVIVARVLSLEAAQQPLVVVLSGSVGYGRGIGRQLVRLARIEPLPILLVITEPDDAEDPRSVAPLIQHPRRTLLELRPLSKARLKELADSLLPLRGRLRDRLIDRAAGRPETLRSELVSLADSQALIAVRGRFRLRVGVQLPARTGEQERAMTRLDAVGGEAGRVAAELLAQVDGPCPEPLLFHAVGSLGAEASPALRRLARAGIARQSQSEWTLVSAELAAALRVTSHRAPQALADALLDASKATGARLPAEWSARLLEAAGRLREALALRIRITRARDRRVHRERAGIQIEASRRLIQKLKLPSSHPDTLAVDLLALKHRSRTGVPHSVSTGEDLAERAMRTGQPTIAGEALRLVSIEYRSTGRLQQAMQAAHACLAALSRSDDPVAQAKALHTLGLAQREMGLHEEALTTFASGTALARPTDPLVARRLLSDTADLLQLLGRWDSASEAIDAADAMSTRGESPRNRTLGTVERLRLVLSQGRFAEARAMAETLIADLRYLGIDNRQAAVLLLAGEAERYSGRFERAEDHYRQALLMFETLESPLATLVRANLSLITYARGDAETACAELTALLTEVEASEVSWMITPLRIARAPAAAVTGRWPIVHEALDALEASATGNGRIDLDCWWVCRELEGIMRTSGTPDRRSQLERISDALAKKLPPAESPDGS